MIFVLNVKNTSSDLNMIPLPPPPLMIGPLSTHKDAPTGVPTKIEVIVTSVDINDQSLFSPPESPY